MNVGIKIYEYLTNKGISQTFLVKNANIDRSKLSLALNGKRKLTFDEYERICGALCVGVDKFLTPRKLNNNYDQAG